MPPETEVSQYDASAAFAVPTGAADATKDSHDDAAADQSTVESERTAVEAAQPTVVRNPPLAPVRLPNKEADNGDEDDDKVDANVSIELPAGLVESFALLKRIQAEPAKTRSDRKVKGGKLAKIKAHIFQLQQGQKAQPMTADDQAKIRAARRSSHTRITARLEELAAKHPELNEAD